MNDNTSNAVLTQRESILEEIAAIYTQDEYGLLAISKIPSLKKNLKRQIILPKKKVIVLIVGSHSTGKSSFVNWFFGDTIQKVSAAIETSKFTFITTGRKRQSLDGAATVRLFNFLEEMKDIPHFIDNLQTEKRLPIEDRSTLVTFIDTPGLIDDSGRVPFDNEKILLDLAKQSQVIFVFSDPLTQAFCDPLINFIKKAHEDSRNKMHFFLTKSDTLDEDERSRIIASIVQKLSSAITNRTIDLRPFHLPVKSLSKMKNGSYKSNHLEEEDNEIIENDKSNSLPLLCEIIDRAVENTVQSNLSQLSQDLSDIVRAAEVTSVSLGKRKTLFTVSTILLLSLIGYFFAALNLRDVYLSSYIYPGLIIVSLIWIISFLIRPNNKDIQRLKVFRTTTSRNANAKLNEFYHEINDPND